MIRNKIASLEARLARLEAKLRKKAAVEMDFALYYKLFSKLQSKLQGTFKVKEEYNNPYDDFPDATWARGGIVDDYNTNVLITSTFENIPSPDGSLYIEYSMVINNPLTSNRGKGEKVTLYIHIFKDGEELGLQTDSEPISYLQKNQKRYRTLPFDVKSVLREIEEDMEILLEEKGFPTLAKRLYF